jgi:hypothetical protein
MKSLNRSTNKGIGLVKFLVILGCIGLVFYLYNGRKAAIEAERQAAADAYAQQQSEEMLKQVQENMANAVMEATMQSKYGGGANLDPEIRKQLEEARQYNNTLY